MSVIVKSVSKTIRSRRVLDGISIEVPDGHVVGLEGVNGSGKTMLMRAVCGLMHVDAGEIFIDGKLLGHDIEIPDSVGILLESPAFLDGFSGFENLMLLARLSGRAGRREVLRALERVGLDPMLKTAYRGYSLGMKQRLGLAAAVMESPALMLLDEPMNALDSDGVELVSRLILEERERGAAVLISCHDGKVLEALSDRVFLMRDGAIVGVREVGSHAA